MKVTHDFTEVKSLTVAMYQLQHLDDQFVFYYDETNNMRKFYLRENGFNWDWKANFVLGGLMHHRDAAIDITPLITSFKFPASMPEIKLKHFGKGDFIQFLGSDKLSLFLLFLTDKEIYVHFSSVNVLYFALVDIVDSVIAPSSLMDKLRPGFDRYLKNTLYELSVIKIDEITKLFLKYKYPNIHPASLKDFADELMSLFGEFKEDHPHHVPLTSLEQLFDAALKKKSLPFITNEEDLVFLRDFSSVYFQRVYLFSESLHILDQEDAIQAVFDKSVIILNGQSLNNYQFVASETNPWIQLSDVICGLLGKFYIYLNSHSTADILAQVGTLDEMARHNLQLLIEVIRKSVDFNPAFVHAIVSDGDMQKFYELEQTALHPFFA